MCQYFTGGWNIDIFKITTSTPYVDKWQGNHSVIPMRHGEYVVYMVECY